MKRGVRQRLNIISRASIGMLVAILFVVSTMGVFAASPPNLITYQGRLLDSNGTPVTDASLSISFELYDDPTAGSCVWSNSSATCATAVAQTVTLTDGLFSENLGDTAASPAYAAIGDDIFADNSALYLKVTVAGEALTPRKQLTSAPYALNSETLDGLNSSAIGGTSAFVPVTDSNGMLTLTGDPTGATVGTGSLYINPASSDANETLFGVALGGSERFRVDEDGDTSVSGDLVLTSATSDIRILESAGATYYGIFDVDDLSADRTYTFPDSTGEVSLLGQGVTLTTETTGNYVTSITNGSGIGGGDGGSEGAALTLSLGALTSDWSQTGAYDLILGNASSELKILESAGATYYGIFDVDDLSVDRTYTFPDSTGTVALTSDLTGSSITLDTAYDAGGSGVGRSITADSGAVAIAAT